MFSQPGNNVAFFVCKLYNTDFLFIVERYICSLNILKLIKAQTDEFSHTSLA